MKLRVKNCSKMVTYLSSNHLIVTRSGVEPSSSLS